MPRRRATRLDDLLRLAPNAAADYRRDLACTYWFELRYWPRRDPDLAGKDQLDWKFLELVLRRYGDKVVAVVCHRYRNGARLFIYFEAGAVEEVPACGSRLRNPRGWHHPVASRDVVAGVVSRPALGRVG